MSKLYTKKGDDGETSLVGGVRVSKGDERVELYGEIDELNSLIGVTISFLADNSHLYPLEMEFLTRLQRKLFDVGALLACEKKNWEKYKLQNLEEGFVEEIEERIDELDDQLPELTSFILPGGMIGVSHLHLCRSVCRRVERSLVRSELKKVDELPTNLIKLLNRLSDYFFVFARFGNSAVQIKDQVIKKGE